MTPNNSSVLPANRAIQADVSELAASRLNQQNQAARAKRFGDHANSQRPPSWRVAQLCFANQAEAFDPALAAR